MRRALVVGLLLLAGCGEAEKTAGPASVDPKLRTPGQGEMPLGEPAAVRGGIPAGETGVLGLDGRASVRPRALAIAEDAELERIEWASWGETAEGSGKLALLECDPHCGSGRTRTVEAAIRLTGPVDCPEGRFYDRATVTIEGRARRQPMSFIQAPC